MATFPFLHRVSQVVGGNATFTFNLSVPDGEIWEIREIRQQSTGAFNITGLRNSNSRQYANAAPASPIPETFFADVANEFHATEALPAPIILKGNLDFFIDVADTTGSNNTIVFVLVIVKTVPGDN